MSGFISPEGELDYYFLSDYSVLDRASGTGTLWGWGTNDFNRVGVANPPANISSPIQTLAYGTNWRVVAEGGVSAAIKTDGTLWVWGFNNSGQLGLNDVAVRSSPIQTIALGTNWKSVASGAEHVAAIKTDGTLWMWGSNFQGELGTNDITNRSSPIQTIAFGNDWKQVSGGWNFTGAIKNDGTLWMWGSNSNGQLGDGSTSRKSSPVQTVAFGNNWKQVSCASAHTAAIKADGTLWTWGSNGSGRLGVGDVFSGDRSSPVQTITGGNNWKQVSVGGATTGAIKTDGTLWMWGTGQFGTLGNNASAVPGNPTAGDRPSPVQTVSGGNNWKRITVGNGFAGATKIDGTLWMWGTNTFGQLGTNDIVNRSSPIQTVARGTNWKQVAPSHNSPFTKALYFNDAGSDYPSNAS